MMWVPLWLFYKTKERETEIGAKEKRNTACPWLAQEPHSADCLELDSKHIEHYTIPFALGVFKISSSQLKTQTRNCTSLNLLTLLVLIQLEGLCPFKWDAVTSICRHNPLRPVKYTEQLSLRRDSFSV